MIKTLIGPQTIPQRHGPLFRAPRRRGRDRRAVRAVLRRCQRPRLQAIHALVFAGRHAGDRSDGHVTTRPPRPIGSTSRRRMRPTPGQPTKEPMVVPLGIGLVGKAGDLPLKLADGPAPERGVLVLDKPSQSFTFTGVAEQPVLSINRGFSAPIKLAAKLSSDDLRAARRARQRPVQPLAGGADARDRLADRQRGAAARRARPGDRRRPARGAGRDPRRCFARARLHRRGAAACRAKPTSRARSASDVDPDAIFRARTGLRALIGLHLNAELTEDLSRA